MKKKQKLTREESLLRKRKYNEKYRKDLKINREAREKDLKIKLKEVEVLFKYLNKELDIDLFSINKTQLIVKYRSLFNYSVINKIKIRQCDLIRFYKSKGRKFTSADMAHSLRMFNHYKNEYPEVKELYNKLYSKKLTNKPVINIDRRNLTYIQKLVDNLEEWQEKELIELITLRKKSWQWKSKDTLKVYSGSY